MRINKLWMDTISIKPRSSWLLKVVGVALAYAVSGRLGLMLAIPPGYATPVWAPSGVALASVILWGGSIWPGVWLGSVLVNISSFIEGAPSSEPLSRALLIAALIGIGASAQAVVGAMLTTRLVRLASLLNEPRDIVKFFTLAAPLSCMVNASIGSFVLLHANLIRWVEFPFTWWTWWIGDTIGVIIFTPLILLWCSSSDQLWPLRRKLFVTGPLAVTFIALVFLFTQVNSREDRRFREDFHHEISTLNRILKEKLSGNLEVLQALVRFYDSSEWISADEFRMFTLDAFVLHPSLRMLAWSPIVAYNDRLHFEADAQSTSPHFQITERKANAEIGNAEARPVYTPMLYVQPYSEGKTLLGFDLSSLPEVRPALDFAKVSGRATAVGPLTLGIDDPKKVGYMVVQPVYRSPSLVDGAPPPSETLKGYVVQIINVPDLLSASLRSIAAEAVQVSLYDLNRAGGEVLLQSQVTPSTIAGADSTQSRDGVGTLCDDTRFDFADHKWEIRASTLPEYFVEHRTFQAWSVLVGGLLFTGMLGAFLLVLTGHTSTLGVTNQQLRTEIEERRLAEERFRVAVEAAPNAMLTVNSDGVISLVNTQVEQVFGYGRDELIGKHLDILLPTRFRNGNPKHWADFVIDRKSPATEKTSDLFGLRKDGSEVPIEIGLSPMSTQEGTFVLASIVDTTARKAADHKQQLLLAELSHRVKNTLAIIHALADRTAAGSNTIADFVRSFKGRISALARAHSLLTASEWRGADLRTLTEDVIKPYRSSAGVNTEINGPKVELPPKASVSLSMILHELSTNAAKYGAFSKPGGRVSVGWELRNQESMPHLHLLWSERGGPLVKTPEQRGFGTRLVEEAAEYDLQGQAQLRFESSGVIYELDFPLDHSNI